MSRNRKASRARRERKEVMSRQEQKERANRIVGFILACSSVGAWLTSFLSWTMTGEGNARVAAFVAPPILLWAMFTGLPSYTEPESVPWLSRRKLVIAGFGAIIVMELLNLSALYL